MLELVLLACLGMYSGKPTQFKVCAKKLEACVEQVEDVCAGQEAGFGDSKVCIVSSAEMDALRESKFRRCLREYK